jgi:2'-5' RNA ligase
MRLFVALELPETVKRDLAALQRALAARLGTTKLRWMQAEQLHLTLLFLGEVPSERLPSVEASLARAAHFSPPLTLETEGLGAFPSLRRPSVLWVGVGGDAKALHALQQRVALELAWLSLADEKRFRAHLTLARVKGFAGPLSLEGASLPPLTWRAERLSLFESTLSPQGARYRRVGTYALGSPDL